MDKVNNALAGLLAVQRDLKAPKGQFNKFGGYHYRSCEDILQAARPLCNENGLLLTLDDEIIGAEGRVYVKATATVTDTATGDEYSRHASAREAATKKGMDEAQITGAASSYARKYALCALFAIDDTKDADTNEYTQRTNNDRQKGAQEARTANTQTSNGANEWKVALNDLVAESQRIGLKPNEVSLLIPIYYGGRTKTKELSVSELRHFKANLERFVNEQTGGCDGSLDG